jgi:uncharacterized protein YerC
MLLTSSPATIKRDIALLKKQGLFIMTRGQKLDMGPGISHKTQIIELYLKGYTFTDIEKKTNHSETSVKRYLADFIQVASLVKQGFSTHQIRVITQRSEKLIREYTQLYEEYNQQQNLIDMLNPQKKSTGKSHE